MSESGDRVTVSVSVRVTGMPMRFICRRRVILSNTVGIRNILSRGFLLLDWECRNDIGSNYLGFLDFRFV